MKKMTKFASLCMALLTCFGLGAMTACNDNGEASSSSSSSANENKTYTAYEFVVKNADGTNADGHFVQLCYVNEDGTEGCWSPVPVVNGECVYTYATEVGAYAVHVLNSDMQQVSLTEEVTTDATAFKGYTLTLADAVEENSASEQA